MKRTFLSIKNFEKFQHYKHRNPPWIKLYYDLLDDDDFISMSIESRHLYMTLLLIAGRKDNRIPHDVDYLRKVLRLDDEPDLTELIEKGFLLAPRRQSASRRLAPCQQNALSETETETESDKTKREGGNAPDGASLPRIDDSRNRNKSGSTLPDGFEPNEKAIAMAHAVKLNPFALAAEFRDHYQANGKTFLDWQAAFRSWIRKEVKLSAERGQGRFV